MTHAMQDPEDRTDDLFEMGSGRSREQAQEDRDRPVWIQPGRPDPFRAAGVPDRLVLVLHREGMHFVGTLTTWEYHEILVHRPNGPDGHAHVVREMVVDTSTPRSTAVVVRMSQRPTAARLVAELVDVLRGMVSRLAGPDPNAPPRPVRRSVYASRPNDVQPPAGSMTE